MSRRAAIIGGLSALAALVACGAFKGSDVGADLDGGADGGDASDAVVDAPLVDAATDDATDAADAADVSTPRVPCTGAACATFAAGLMGVTYVAVDDSSVAWSSFGDGSVGICAVASCASPLQLETGVSSPSFVSLTPTKVYWAVGTQMHVSSRTSMTTATYADYSGTVGGIATTGETVFWTEGGFVCRDLCNGLYTGGFSGLTAVAVAPAAALVFAATGSGIYQLPMSLGPNPPPLFASDPSAVALATDSAALFWMDPSSTADLKRQQIDVDAGGGTKTLASKLNQPFGIAVDATDVYLTTAGGGTVERIPRGGAPKTILATGLAAPKGIALDGTYVYVAVSGENRIIRIPKLP